jgi:hypothetical protein
MNDSPADKVGLTQKLAHEVRQLVAIFVYLSVFFLTFKLYTRLILAEYRINYFEYGLTLLKSLALAKIILTGEALRLGERYRDRPLIVPTLHKTVVFSAFALAFELLEHQVLGLLRGKAPAEVLAEWLDKGWPYLAAMIVVVFVAFLPFFAFREMERVLGEGKVRDLFLKPRVAVEPRPSAENSSPLRARP